MPAERGHRDGFALAVVERCVEAGDEVVDLLLRIWIHAGLREVSAIVPVWGNVRALSRFGILTGLLSIGRNLTGPCQSWGGGTSW